MNKYIAMNEASIMEVEQQLLYVEEKQNIIHDGKNVILGFVKNMSMSMCYRSNPHDLIGIRSVLLKELIAVL